MPFSKDYKYKPLLSSARTKKLQSKYTTTALLGDKVFLYDVTCCRKSNLHCIRGITPRRETRGEPISIANLRALPSCVAPALSGGDGPRQSPHVSV